jgi:hypothetical protein
MLRLVTDGFETPEKQMAASVRALADLIEGGLDVQHGVIVAVVDGAVSYAPLGNISLVEATGLLELVSRKIERDLSA